MRDLIAIMESTMEPSPGLKEAAVAWISGWHHDERQAVEARMLDNLYEAQKYARRVYPVLYRGMEIGEEEERKLRAGGSIVTTTTKLMSWTKTEGVALDYAQGIIVAKSDLFPILDIEMILPHLDDVMGDDEISADHIRYAEREAEVICLHDGRMTIHATDVIWPEDILNA